MSFDSGWIGADAADDHDQRLANESEQFDLTRPHVMTVLGPIEPGALGVSFVHETVVAAPAALTPDHAPGTPLDHTTRVELDALYAVGGRAVVDTGAVVSSQMLARLQWIAGRAPVHLIAVAHHASAGTNQRQSAGGVLLRQLTIGAGELTVRAGLILIDANEIEDRASRAEILPAVALAHQATGAPVMLRSHDATTAATLLDLLDREGVAASRVMICGLAPTTSLAADLKLLATGAYRTFDRVARDDRDAAAHDAAAIRGLIDRSYGAQVLLSPGLRPRTAAEEARAGADWGWVLEHFTIDLMEAGLDASRVGQLLVDNPAQVLAIRPERR